VTTLLRLPTRLPGAPAPSVVGHPAHAETSSLTVAAPLADPPVTIAVAGVTRRVCREAWSASVRAEPTL